MEENIQITAKDTDSKAEVVMDKDSNVDSNTIEIDKVLTDEAPISSDANIENEDGKEKQSATSQNVSKDTTESNTQLQPVVEETLKNQCMSGLDTTDGKNRMDIVRVTSQSEDTKDVVDIKQNTDTSSNSSPEDLKPEESLESQTKNSGKRLTSESDVQAVADGQLDNAETQKAEKNVHVVEQERTDSNGRDIPNGESPNPTDSKSGTPTPNSNQLDPLMKSVYLGRCSFEKLPPLTKKVIRIFVSSTFSGKN